MKKIVSMMFLALLLLTMVSCNKNNDLIGQWNMTEAESIGIEIIMTITDDQIEMMGQFNDYKVKGNKLVLLIEGNEVDVDFDFDGNTLKLGTGEDEQIFKKIEN